MPDTLDTPVVPTPPVGNTAPVGNTGYQAYREISFLFV